MGERWPAVGSASGCLSESGAKVVPDRAALDCSNYDGDRDQQTANDDPCRRPPRARRSGLRLDGTSGRSADRLHEPSQHAGRWKGPVSVAALSAEEGNAAYGVDLADKGIQPVWVEVDNHQDRAYWLLPRVSIRTTSLLPRPRRPLRPTHRKGAMSWRNASSPSHSRIRRPRARRRASSSSTATKE
jgi:hypothetical protein